MRTSRPMGKHYLVSIVKVCVIMHNMICDARKASFTGTTNILSDYDEELLQALPIQLRHVMTQASTFAQACEWRKHIDATESPVVCR